MKLYNKILEDLILPLGDVVLGTKYIASLKEWRKIQHYSEEQLNHLHDQKLEKVLRHAARHIPYYEHLSQLETLRLHDFPVVTKREIRENVDRFLWNPNKKHRLVCEKSSGSSGVQGQVYMSKEEQSKVMAAQTLLWEWAGYSIGKSLLQTGMTLRRGRVKAIKDYLFRTQYESAFGLDESQVVEVLDSLRRKPRQFFGGYASSLYVYATVARKMHRRIRFQSVISWGDKMFSHYRSLIESTFETRVFDTYGTTEGFMIAGQKDLPYYYILSPHVHVEILDKDGKELPDGELGHVVVTSLDAYEMPLIRYYLGDLAVKLPRNKYPEFRSLNFPLLERIVGRDTDIIRTPSGKKMIVHFFTAIFEHIPEISQFRVVQKELESITVEYIPSEGFDPTVLERVRQQIQTHLLEEYPVHFVEVNSIPASPSGKPQIVVSHI